MLKPESDRWNVITSTPHEHEQFGLDLLRESLPDQRPYRAWANFEFIADSGQIYEVDCLVVTEKGLFLVELKHYAGTLEGAGVNRWYRTVGSRKWEEDNPLLLANRKAKFLRSLLQAQVGRKVRLPFITPLVFLSNASQDVRLTSSAATGITGPQGASWVGKGKVPSIGWALTSTQPDADGHKPRTYTEAENATAVRAFGRLDIRPSVGRRSVRDYILGEVLEHGDVYQDFAAQHRRYPERARRVRLYPHPKSASKGEQVAGARAAEREFTLFSASSHPGIDSPQEFEEHELGPALLFDYNPDEVRLDQWLRLHADDLSVEDRLQVVRDIAEALGHAHDDRIFHRALEPHAVYVAGGPGSAQVRIRNWHAGVRATLDDGQTRLPTMTSASSLADAVTVGAESVERYRSPELRQVVNAKPRTADVFSLGALAFLVIAGRDAASSAAELDEILLENDGLAIDSAIDGVSESLQFLVWQATQKVPTDRFASTAEFLAALDEVEAEARVDEPPVPELEADPLQARKGDVLADRFEVKGRLGKGATAVALLVADEDARGEERVLKIALSEQSEAQLRDEALALGKLQHQRVVRLIGDPLVIGGRLSLLMARAGQQTLGQRLAKDGRVEIEFLERWGSDLLEAVAYLEEMGIAHRDLKPSNIGVAAQGKNTELHLVLFDFSLTRVPDNEIKVGTTGFIDPFLRSEGRNRWDSHAERFAAAVVLYQMVTNELPVWGPGGVDPLMVEDEVTLDPARFDSIYASSFTEFFRSALARDVANRFGSANEMLEAWHGCFVETAHTATTAEPPAPPRSLTPASPVGELTMSNKVASTLERASVYTVADLLAIDLVQLNRRRGVGKKTVAEVRELVANARELVGTEPTPAETPVVSLTGPVSVDRLVSELLGASASDKEHRILEAHLGLNPKGESPLPNQTAVAMLAKTNQGTVSRVLIEVRQLWATLGSLTAARGLVAQFLARQQGVATLDQLATSLLSRCGSTEPEPARSAYGRAAVRAALDVEADQPDARWVLRRRGDVLIAALDPDVDANADTNLAPAESAIAWVVRLAKVADELADRKTPVTIEVAAAELHAVKAPASVRALPDRALLALASSASDRAEMSSTGEIYPRAMSGADAIRRSVGSLLGLKALSRKDLERRIRARFPAAEELPPNDEITSVLSKLGLPFTWDPAGGGWITPDRSAGSLALTSITASSTVLATDDEASDFGEQLELAHSSGRLLVLAAPIRRGRHRRALEALSAHDVAVVDVDRLLIDGLKRKAAEYEVDWHVVLEADAASAGSGDANNLNMLVGQVVDVIEATLTSMSGTVLLHNLGLMARYGHLALIERLRTAIQSGNTQPLRSVWVLTATESSSVVPIVDGQVIGLVSPNEFVQVPPAWLENQERVA